MTKSTRKIKTSNKKTLSNTFPIIGNNLDKVFFFLTAPNFALYQNKSPYMDAT